MIHFQSAVGIEIKVLQALKVGGGGGTSHNQCAAAIDGDGIRSPIEVAISISRSRREVQCAAVMNDDGVIVVVIAEKHPAFGKTTHIDIVCQIGVDCGINQNSIAHIHRATSIEIDGDGVGCGTVCLHINGS